MVFTRPSQAVLPPSRFVQVLLFDAVLYTALCWRDLADPAQMLIAHYVSFILITDLGLLFLPRVKRNWYNLFRLTGGVSFLVMFGALWAQGLDGEALWLTLLRMGLILGRIGHALWLFRGYGPQLNELMMFPLTAWSRYRAGTRSERLGYAYLIVAVGMLFFPQLAYWTHSNGGVVALDAILTGFQAQQGVNVALKMLVLETLVRSTGTRLVMRIVVAVPFLLQWPLMFGMFWNAPIPLAHGALELFELALVVTAFAAWWRDRAHDRMTA